MDAINGYVEMGGASRFLDAALVNSLNEARHK